MRDNLKFYICDDNSGFADRIKKEIDLYIVLSKHIQNRVCFDRLIIA